jgi:predicted DNA-binding transcriptional regulator YafY
MNRIFKNSQCKEPVRITILPERNAVERFMMEFADCQKKTEYDKISGVCKAALYFDTKNETEILIKLLSFGPVIKIDAPQSFINLFEKRLENQNELFKLYNHKSDNI